MLRGLTVSTIVHASVLAMAVLSWPHQKSDCDKMIERLQKEEPGLAPVDILMRLPQCASAIDVPIDFVEIGLVTDIAPVQKAEEPQEEEEAVPEEVEEAPEPPPQEESAPEEEEVVIPDEEPEPPPPEKKEEPKKEEPPPKKEEPKLIEKQKPKADNDLDFLNEFEDILKDKAQDERRTPTEEVPPQINKPVLRDAQETRPGAGERRGNTASLQAAMRRQIYTCWRGVSDLPKEDQIDVQMRVTLNRDGTLKGNVELVSPRSRPIGRSGIAVDVALRAVRKCAPYQLPEDDYDLWKDINVTVSPTQP
nr:cell envelope integrity protein TolA [uncultured Hyphomonas sp.]